jgi:hypothetical protein
MPQRSVPKLECGERRLDGIESEAVAEALNMDALRWVAKCLLLRVLTFEVHRFTLSLSS